MKTISAVFFSILFLSAPQARAAGPGGVERIGGDLGLNLTQVNFLSLHLQRAQLLRDQMYLAVDLKADEHALSNELRYVAEGRAREHKGKLTDNRPEDLIPALRDAARRDFVFDLEPRRVKTAKKLVASVDRKRDALEQLKAMLYSVNAEIQAMTKAAGQSSENPKSPGAASGPLTR